jgi:hypothetical protein
MPKKEQKGIMKRGKTGEGKKGAGGKDQGYIPFDDGAEPIASE